MTSTQQPVPNQSHRHRRRNREPRRDPPESRSRLTSGSRPTGWETLLQGITFHSFPKDVERRKAWVQFVHRENWEPATSSKLCTKHFAERDVDRTSLVCIRLRENAVPTIGESQITLFSWVFGKNQYFLPSGASSLIHHWWCYFKAKRNRMHPTESSTQHL
ncbi:THAP domain-containing protein 2-like [Diabrotica virgifera virgifera]|uniref:THAP-type domain-containing protein n=1 Tax=Diabrotica virgifera virgifera TaxID=50390 RepID=A0ABM5K011_DIAVI|nr:THAP domain-containing protein 2-like [Diabrotica virgifera virgifera]